MATISFASILARHLTCPSRELEATTLKEALEMVFRENPRLEGYLLDDQGRLRQHVVIAVDGQMIRGRNLATQLRPDSSIYVLQSLTGG